MHQTGENHIERLMELEPATVMDGYRSGRISRRDLSKLFAALGLTAALGPAIGRNPALAQSNELTMIVWEGYTSDSFTIPWEEANDVNVEATFAGTGDDDAGLLMEIDATKLTNYPDLYEQFQRPPYITFDDKLYGVNFAWGPTIILYNPDEVAETPTSWNALLDEQYSGKITTWNYPLQIAQYALLLDPKPEDPFLLDDEQLAQVKDILVRQRPLVRKYWDLGGEIAELFLNGEVVISDGWSWITLQIQDSEGSVAEATPEEGVTGWSDSWCISNKAPNPELALQWADYMIGPEGQMGVIENLNYSITNSKVVETLPTELREQLRMVDVPAEYAKIHMWKFVPNYDKWVQIWQEATAS
ncbi:MAG: potD 5 [Thermomicrobiales bacterium]|nr:potD 5 [Thermomicrobiales bacterium]